MDTGEKSRASTSLESSKRRASTRCGRQKKGGGGEIAKDRSTRSNSTSSATGAWALRVALQTAAAVVEHSRRSTKWFLVAKIGEAEQDETAI